jgi:hypothetical protein
MKQQFGLLALRIVGVAFLAGPLFALLMGLFLTAANFIQGVPLPPVEGFGALLLFLGLASLYGAIYALPAYLIGGFGMAALGMRYRWARLTFAWEVMGGAIGIPVGLVFGAGDALPASAAIAIAAIAAGAACGWICRYQLDWPGDEAGPVEA